MLIDVSADDHNGLKSFRANRLDGENHDKLEVIITPRYLNKSTLGTI